MAINDPTPEIAQHYTRWAKNRAFVSGEQKVKGMGAIYQPMPDAKMKPNAYADWLMRVSFFPAARRTTQGYSGLMFRKRPVLSASPAMDALAKVITPDGDRHEDLAFKLAEETLITNFSGLFTDHPAKQPGLSAATAFAAGQRPFVSLYIAESILEATTALVRGQKRLVRVRLLEQEGKRVRELVLNNGVYEVRVHDFDGSQWVHMSTTQPRQRGKLMSDIPFHIVSSGNSYTPELGLIDDVVNLNHSHYLHQGDLTSTYRYLSRPVPYVIGVQAPEGGWAVTPGNVLEAPDGKANEVEFGYLQYAGAGVDHLIDQRDHLEGQMAKVGARILASDKNAAEAAETHAIRRASENATLASVANNISRSLTAALQDVANWIGDTQEVTYAINTDYIPQRMDAGEISAYVGMVQAGLMSVDTFILTLRDRGAVDPALDPEEEKDRISEDQTKSDERVLKNTQMMASLAKPDDTKSEE